MRLLFRVAVALIVALALLLGALLVLPGDKIADLAADQVEAQTGRALEIGGPVKFSLWPVLGVRADDVSFANANWVGTEAPPMLQAERVSIGLDAAALIRGDVRVKEIRAVAPALHLATRADGQGNWVFGEVANTQAVGAGTSGTSAGYIIEKLVLERASLTYAAFGAAPIVQSGLDLELLWPEPDGTADLSWILRPAGEPVEVVAEIGSFKSFLEGQVASVGATLRAGGGRARFDGRASIAGDASGRFTLEAVDTGKVLNALGLEDPGLSPGLGKSIVLGTDATFTTDGRLALRDLTVKLDQNELTGDADVVLSAVPQVTARLEAGDLDVSGLTEASGAAATSEASSSGWSKDPIDVSALALFNGSIGVKLKSLDTGSVKLGMSDLNLSVDRARAVLGISQAAIFGGQVSGQLVANNRNGLSVGGKLNANNIDLNQALGQLADIHSMNGEALTQLEFLGVGNDMDTIMRSLSGKGWFEVGKGFFTGFDLEELMRSGQGNGGSTVFDSLTASYVLRNGNLLNEDLLMLIKGLRIEGEGRIGLGAQDLDYTFLPQATHNGQALRIPVKVTGPWVDPSIRPDLSQILEAEIELKKDEVEAQAKEFAREKLEAEFDTQIDPEADLEEVLKDELEKKAKDSLFKLLGVD
ncbi:MAG: AsmA family protein [Rhodobacteraceae bacterium]|nr:AsmA family protein [Paracoccaceae bacterium]